MSERAIADIETADRTTRLDTVRLGKVLALLGSPVPAERAQAAVTADRLVQSAGMSWAEFTAAADREAVATEAAAALLTENEQLRAALAAAAAGPGIAPGWQEVGTTAPGDHRTTALWALDMHVHSAIALSERERDFLNTCSRWSGRLTLRQQSWFDVLLSRICAQTGRRPPA